MAEAAELGRRETRCCFLMRAATIVALPLEA